MTSCIYEVGGLSPPLLMHTPSKQCSGAARFSQLLAEGKETRMAAVTAAAARRTTSAVEITPGMLQNKECIFYS
jgi:hypothetical protein